MEYKCVRCTGLQNLYTPIYRQTEIHTIGETMRIIEQHPGLHISSHNPKVGEVLLLSDHQLDWPIQFLKIGQP